MECAQDTLLILTVKGTLLRKAPSDSKWVDLGPQLKGKLDTHSIESLVQSYSNPETVFIQGSSQASWITTDCGLHILTVNHRQGLARWLFNPAKDTCALGLFINDPVCKATDPTCIQNYVLRVTTDLGRSWQGLEESVRDGQWYSRSKQGGGQAC